MFLRWPAFAIFAAVLCYVLFRVFSWGLNSYYLHKQINRVVNPKDFDDEESDNSKEEESQ